MNRALVPAALAAGSLLLPHHAHAHAVAGSRLFVNTLIIDDPAVADEAALPNFSSVAVLGPSGQAVRAGPLRAGNDRRDLIVPLPPLAPGQYTVVWHVTSQDTHKTEGRFSFTVGR